MVATFFDSPAWKAAFPYIQSWFRRTTWQTPTGEVDCDPKSQGTDCCLFPTGTVANYTIMVNVPGHSSECQHHSGHWQCNWHNLSAHFCGNTKAFDPPVGCWPDAAGFQRVGPQKLYTADPGFVDFDGGNYGLRPDSRIFRDFPGFPPVPFDKIGPQP